MKGFKDWLNEVSTSTADVAHFSLPIGAGMVTRNFPQFFNVKDYGFGGPIQHLTSTDYIPEKRKKHRKKHS
jgi:hypothetical protein